MDLREQLEIAKKRAYSLKTRKAQTKAWNVVKELRREILLELYDQRNAYATQSVKGTVRWFSSGDDYVAINTLYGTLYASPTSDVVSKSWYGHTCCVEYIKGQEVVLEIEVAVDSDRLTLRLIPRRVYGGTLNEVQYAELCKRDNLAFFKYPNSDGVTGLFAQPKAVSNE